MVKTFRLKSTHVGLLMKSYKVSDADLLDFTAANPLEMGEWVTLNASEELARCADPGVTPGPFVVYNEKGRSDTQGIGGRGMTTVIMGGTFVGETKIFEGTPALGAALEAADVTYLTLTKSGLQAYTSGTGIGHVLKTAAANNGWLRFLYTAS